METSVIVKVDSTADEIANPEGRSNILKEYIETTNAGEPWVIPADTIEVTSIKPLSLNDLALSDGVTLDKKTVAAILDVPAFWWGQAITKNQNGTILSIPGSVLSVMLWNRN